MEIVEPSVLHGLQALDGLRRGRTTAPDKKPVRPVHSSQIDAIMPYVAPAVGAMVRLQELTGMRPNEVVQLRGCDLNMSGNIWSYRPEHHKLEHLDVERVIPLGPKAQEILKPWLKPELGAYLFCPQQTMDQIRSDASSCWTELRRNRMHQATKSDRSRDAVAVSAEVRKRRNPMAPGRIKAKKRKGRKSRVPGDRYGVASYRRAIHRACDLAKIDRWSPNRLRHTAATRVRREMGIDAARALLGHSDADTTTIYAERDQELARTAMERLG